MRSHFPCRRVICTGLADDEKGVNIRETENKMSESSYWQETKIY